MKPSRRFDILENQVFTLGSVNDGVADMLTELIAYSALAARRTSFETVQHHTFRQWASLLLGGERTYECGHVKKKLFVLEV